MARIQVENDPGMQENSQIQKTRLIADQTSDNNCFRRLAATSSLSLLHEKFDPTIDPAILRTLSSSPLQGMSLNPSDTSVGGLPIEDSLDSSFRATDPTSIPRRNLTEAFEELYLKPSNDVGTTPVIKQTISKDGGSSMISPTGVMELGAELTKMSEPLDRLESNVATPNKDDTVSKLPHYDLPSKLKRELSDALVDRISFYAVIHDINKEATSMAANDDSGYNRNPQEIHEQYDPLIVAVNGCPDELLSVPGSIINFALIDEERWLLDALDSRSSEESRSINACPPTFLQAIGEREYENPINYLSNGSRTQLWKPSRSWWEAKSGKNPWIEPKSHNKRWRYLWPLIHYHKFLARCVKKLKRNGVDVKTSVSPVSVFVREEVCAVSDHLAAVSLFDSDRWMDCLIAFVGWTDPSPKAEGCIRDIVAELKLRPLAEPGDVDSPLLRSQIDEQYLRAMASARAQMTGPATDERRKEKDQSSKSSRQTQNLKSKKNGASRSASGPPPAYPRSTGSTPSNQIPSNVQSSSPANPGQQRWGYQHQAPQWWGGGWHPHASYHYGDDTSVQSGLSGDSYPYDMGIYPGQMPHPHYFHPMVYPQQHMQTAHQGAYDPTMQNPAVYGAESYSSEHRSGAGWAAPPHSAPQAGFPAQPGTPGTSHPILEALNSRPAEQSTPDQNGGDQTPYKYDPTSPYWGHLDHTTLAMMGIATPQAVSTPQTQSRGMHSSPEGNVACGEDINGTSMNVQPLLLQQQYPAYGYGPPSPATQFMMSPQAHFGYGYSAYRGFSPSRQTSPLQSSPRRSGSSKTSQTNAHLSPTVTPPSKPKRICPVTADTIIESESL